MGRKSNSAAFMKKMQSRRMQAVAEEDEVPQNNTAPTNAMSAVPAEASPASMATEPATEPATESATESATEPTVQHDDGNVDGIEAAVADMSVTPANGSTPSTPSNGDFDVKNLFRKDIRRGYMPTPAETASSAPSAPTPASTTPANGSTPSNGGFDVKNPFIKDVRRGYMPTPAEMANATHLTLTPASTTTTTAPTTVPSPATSDAPTASPAAAVSDPVTLPTPTPAKTPAAAKTPAKTPTAAKTPAATKTPAAAKTPAKPPTDDVVFAQRVQDQITAIVRFPIRTVAQCLAVPTATFGIDWLDHVMSFGEVRNGVMADILARTTAASPPTAPMQVAFDMEDFAAASDDDADDEQDLVVDEEEKEVDIDDEDVQHAAAPTVHAPTLNVTVTLVDVSNDSHTVGTLTMPMQNLLHFCQKSAEDPKDIAFCNAGDRVWFMSQRMRNYVLKDMAEKTAVDTVTIGVRSHARTSATQALTDAQLLSQFNTDAPSFKAAIYHHVCDTYLQMFENFCAEHQINDADNDDAGVSYEHLVFHLATHINRASNAPVMGMEVTVLDACFQIREDGFSTFGGLTEALAAVAARVVEIVAAPCDQNLLYAIALPFICGLTHSLNKREINYLVTQMREKKTPFNTCLTVLQQSINKNLDGRWTMGPTMAEETFHSLLDHGCKTNLSATENALVKIGMCSFSAKTRPRTSADVVNVNDILEGNMDRLPSCNKNVLLYILCTAIKYRNAAPLDETYLDDALNAMPVTHTHARPMSINTPARA